ncbi:hypothetical protein WBJ53_04520 [Spirosoma sp. SC4-14]|uniref:hypothetical protein n=1 Tax=Spirosoma sp. SC4-14 TaxID=3128900 RepID=UPI0030D353C4
MKKTIIYAFTIGFLTLIGCRDESLNPIPDWEPGVHGFGVFADITEGAVGSSNKANIADYGKNFPLSAQNADAAKVNFKLRWVSLDNKLTVSKIEVYVDMIESYTDPDGNPKTASLGSGGVLAKTITPAAGNRQWNAFSLSPTEVYNLFKDATVKYDKVNAVPVFNNPATPRPAGAWFNKTDKFVLTWRLTTTDGLVFKTWEPSSICADPTAVSEASANCSLTWSAR